MDKNNEDITRRSPGGLTTVSQTLLPLARKLLGKKGFVETDIITGWSGIVGKELAEYSFPQKISFPRDSKTGGSLYLSVPSGAFALEIKHREKYILDRINTYFGYNAVSGLKIMQNLQPGTANGSPDDSGDFPPYAYKLNREEEKYIENLAEPIDNQNLKSIIAKLGKSILNKNKNKK